MRFEPLTAAPATGSRLSTAVESIDHTRGSSEPSFGRRAHKEWHHFVVLADDVEVLVNFSNCDRVPELPGHPADQPRVVFLARERRWDGDIENFGSSDARIDHGRIRFELGANSLVFRDGAFRIDAELRDRPMMLRLSLTPVTKPVFVPSTPMRDGPPLHWVVVPRLRAEGTLTIDGREHVLDGAPAYHDHNWGHFLWGHDLSWEWGFVLPEDSAVPWCLVFVRLTDRARTTAFDHKLLLWHGSALARSFREGEITTDISAEGFQPSDLFQVPRALALLAPERKLDLPASFSMHAAAGDDRVSLRSQPYDAVQVLIPSETDLGLTIFNEVSARVHVTGQVGGQSIDFRGRSMMELIRHV